MPIAFKTIPHSKIIIYNNIGYITRLIRAGLREMDRHIADTGDVYNWRSND